MSVRCSPKSFWRDESGAVTTDWVVLTSAIVGISVAVIATINNSTNTLAGSIDTALVNQMEDPADQAGGQGSEDAEEASGFQAMELRSISESRAESFAADFADDSERRLTNRVNRFLTRAEDGQNTDRQLDIAGIAIAEMNSRNLDTTEYEQRYDAFR